jgi:hypothetical protein
LRIVGSVLGAMKLLAEYVERTTDFERMAGEENNAKMKAGSSPHWVKVKNPKAPAVKREAEEDWGRR